MSDRNGDRRKVQLPYRMTGAGIECTECGCREHWTNRTTKIGSQVMRYRICRNCGHHFKTFEVGPTPNKKKR